MKPKLIIGNKNYSSWSLRPWLLMKEAGIDFDEHRIVLDTPTTKREIAVYSPAGRVPVLQLGDLAVWDSLARANENLDPDFYQQLFYKLYEQCQQSGAVPGKKFRFKGKLFSLDGSLIDLSLKVFPWADIAPKKGKRPAATPCSVRT